MKPFYTAACAILLALGATAQDNCLEALEIVPGEYTVPSIDGSEVPTPICAPNGIGLNTDSGRWYKYTPEEEVTATVNTSLAVNAGVDNRVHIYKGECGGLVCVAGDDDSGAGFLCVVSWPAEEGTTYYIAFDNRWSSAGFDFVLYEQDINTPGSIVSFTTQSLPFMTRTLGAVDMNGDYLDDLLDVNSTNVFTLTQNTDVGFFFSAVPTPPAQFPYSWSIAAGDITGNGYNDLLYGSGQGVSFMFRNDDGIGFTHWAAPNYVFSQRSNFIDLNNDGHLDAFVCHDVAPNVYYLNDGEGNLSFFQGGLSDVPNGGNYGSIWVDYNNDTLPDLFIAKCRGGASAANINQLFRNNGDGTFTEVSEESGLDDSVQTWSSAWGDFNNDGWMDVLVGASNFNNGIHRLMINNGDGTFTNITEGSGFDLLPAVGIEWVAYDFNNDGYIDVLGANGNFMINNGDMTFSNFVLQGVNNGPIGDLNNDGFLDIANGTNLHINDGNENNWVKVNTQGTVSNPNGIGSRVVLYTPAGMQIRDVQSGVGFRFMNTLNVHFGIGTETQVDSLVVLWPSGTVDTYYDLDINTFHMLVEGETAEVIDPLSVASATPRIGMVVFPNPAQDALQLRVEQYPRNGRVTVYDLQGRAVLQRVFSDRLDISSLGAGTYVLKLTSEDFVTEVKFVKNQ